MSLSEVDFLHYNSHILIPEIGDVGQEKFNNATVMIIGLGGLGCPVATYLAASGIGRVDYVILIVLKKLICKYSHCSLKMILINRKLKS